MTPRLHLLCSFVVVAGMGSAFAAEAPAAAPSAPASTPSVAPARAPASPSPNPAAPRNDSSAAPATSFDAFRLVVDRNIFNPNRTGRRERSNDAAPPRLDVITLVGTMDSDQGLRAFFDGSAANFRKVLRVGESVDKFKVTKIAPNLVDLERDGKTLSLRVGQQLQRPEGVDWNLVADASPRAAVATDPARSEPSSSPAIPANADEVTRRLMERRAKALKN